MSHQIRKHKIHQIKKRGKHSDIKATYSPANLSFSDSSIDQKQWSYANTWRAHTEYKRVDGYCAEWVKNHPTTTKSKLENDFLHFRAFCNFNLKYDLIYLIFTFGWLLRATERRNKNELVLVSNHRPVDSHTTGHMASDSAKARMWKCSTHANIINSSHIHSFDILVQVRQTFLESERNKGIFVRVS